MRKELELIQIIEKYLHNQLSPEDKIAFEEKLKTDTRLQKEVELQKDLIEGIKRIGIKQSIQKAGRKYKNGNKGYFLGSFLIVTVASLAGFNYLNNTGEYSDNLNIKQVEVVMDSLDQETVDFSVNNGNEELQTETDSLLDNTEIDKVQPIALQKKEIQYFKINSSEDKTITGKEGTKITFKANSFDVPKNSVIEIELKEYYKMSDIVFSNLTTETKDGQLLETGGMIYFDARANNKKVELKENASYTIKFPTKNEKKKENMKLFDGEMSDKTIIWKQQKDENDKVKRRPFRPWQNVGIRKVVKEKDRDKETIRATFKGGREKLIEYLKNTTRYPQKAIDERISGTVYLSFFIDTTGKIITPRIIHDAGVHPMLDEEAIRVVQSMPEWTPEEIFGNKTLTRRTVPIKFALNGTTPVYDYTNDDFIHFSDSVNAKRRKAYGKRWINEDGSFKDFINDTSLALQDLSHYALSGSKLGWINCDRFTRMRGEKINLSIKLDSKYASVKLIFHDIKSVMQGSNRTGYSRFKNLPKGKKASVFAIQYRDKKPFVCFKEITITNNYIRLDFEELTKSKLAEYTDRINNI